MSTRNPPRRALRRASLSTALAALLLAQAAGAQCPESSLPMAGALQAGAEFGSAVALSGDVAVIGAPGWTPPGGVPEGAAIVSTWTGSAWVSSMLPRPASLSPGCRFGQDVAINEDATIIAVGAPLHDGPAIDGGKVVIYEWDVPTQAWSLALDVDGIAGSGLFGTSVSASGERVAAGEPGGVFGLGAVSVSRRTAPLTWIPDGLFVGSELFAGFGFDVALDGELLAVGSPLDDDQFVDEGAVDVYEWLGGAWSLREHVLWYDPAPSGFFGWSVDLDDELLAVGNPGPTSAQPGGTASVLHWSGSAYLSYLVHWALEPAARLGQSLAVEQDRFVVGAPAYDGGVGVEAGRLSAFQRSPWGSWLSGGVFSPSGAPEAGAQFGFATAVSGRRALAGKPFADPGGLTSAGLVLAYDLGSSSTHVDLGDGLAGQAGVVPDLSGDGGMCGLTNEWIVVHDARPGSPIWLVLGVAYEPLPFKGGVFVPRPDVILALGSTHSSGEVGLDLQVPTGLPAFSLWWQFWFQDPDGVLGFSASNGLRADYPPY